MKKLLSLLLAVLLLVSMVACGKNKEVDIDTNVEATQNNTSAEDPTTNVEEDTTIDSKFDWEVKNIERPDDKITLRTVKKQIAENVSPQNTLTDSRLTNYTVESVKEKLAQNDFIANKYVLGLSYDEETYYKEYGDIGLQKRYHYDHSVVGVLKEKAADSKYFNDLRVTYYGDTNISTGYDTVSVTLYDVEIKKENQAQILQVLNDCMPQEVAYYLVYAQDDDGKMKDGKVLADGKNLYITFEDDNFVYYLKRELEAAKDEYSKSRVNFTYGVLEEKFRNEYEFYTGDYVSKNDSMKYMPNEFFSSKLGNLNLTAEPSKFMDDYFKAGSDKYVGTRIRDGWYWITQTIGDNGINVYEVRVEPVGGDENYALIACPYLDIRYEVIEKDGKVIDMNYTIENQSTNIDDGADVTTSHKKLLTNMTKQIKMILGDDVDLSALSYDNLKVESDTKRSGSTKVIINFKGTEQEVEVSVSLGHSTLGTWRGSYELSISMF